MYSRQTPVSIQLGGRPTIAFSGDVSSTWQHSIRGTPLKRRVPLDAKIHKWVKKFLTVFLVHHLAKCVEIWHDDVHWFIADRKRFW